MHKNQLHVCQKTIGPQNIKGQKAIMPKKPAPRLPEDLWTATHQKPESYHAQKTCSKSSRRLLDHNTSKARRLPCPKNRLHVCQKTFGPQHIKGQKNTMSKKPASHLPEALWTTTHQRPLGYHAQNTGSTSARRPLDRNTSKARRLPCLKDWLLVC
jgi:hypothetical protein